MLRTMFAVYAAEPSPENPLASLRVGERPEPEVPAGWVRVAVKAASLNMHDLWTLRGVGIKPEQFPMILGCDGAGTLDDGTEVVLHSVIGDPNWSGEETLDPKRTLLTEKHQGTFADYVTVPARNALPKPADLSFAEAACMGTAWLTAYRMLFVPVSASGSPGEARRSAHWRPLSAPTTCSSRVRACRNGSTRCSRPSARPRGRIR
jgi:NADPH:quinone reductase-like Zn-dependent oxidoreductase